MRFLFKLRYLWCNTSICTQFRDYCETAVTKKKSQISFPKLMSKCMLVAMETYHLKLTLVNLRGKNLEWIIIVSDVNIVFSILETKIYVWAQTVRLHLCYLYWEHYDIILCFTTWVFDEQAKVLSHFYHFNSFLTPSLGFRVGCLNTFKTKWQCFSTLKTTSYGGRSGVDFEQSVEITQDTLCIYTVRIRKTV